MNRAYQAIVVLFVAIVGIWGCSQGPANRAALAERVKILETKCARLEDDLRNVASARDQARHRAEEQIEQLKLATGDRDELKTQLQMRTGERDQVAGQYELFRKSIKDLIGEAETAVLRFPDGEPV